MARKKRRKKKGHAPYGYIKGTKTPRKKPGRKRGSRKGSKRRRRRRH